MKRVCVFLHLNLVLVIPRKMFFPFSFRFDRKDRSVCFSVGKQVGWEALGEGAFLMT